VRPPDGDAEVRQHRGRQPGEELQAGAARPFPQVRDPNGACRAVPRGRTLLWSLIAVPITHEVVVPALRPRHALLAIAAVLALTACADPTAPSPVRQTPLATGRVAAGGTALACGVTTGSSTITCGATKVPAPLACGVTTGSSTITCGATIGTSTTASGVTTGSSTIAGGVTTGSSTLDGGVTTGSSTVEGGVTTGSSTLDGGVTTGSSTH